MLDWIHGRLEEMFGNDYEPGQWPHQKRENQRRDWDADDERNEYPAVQRAPEVLSEHFVTQNFFAPIFRAQHFVLFLTVLLCQ